MGIVTAKLTITNHADEVLAKAMVISPERIRKVALDEVLVDTGATTLCLPKNIVETLGLEPDLKNSTLRALPMDDTGSFLLAYGAKQRSFNAC